MKKISLALTAATLFVACGNDAKNIHTLEAADFAAVLQEQSMPLVDVRTAEEYAEGHLPGAINVDVKQPDFSNRATQAIKESGNQDSPVAVYCLRGSRSMKAATLLAKEGKEVYNLAGGITAWKEAGMPVEK